MRHPLPTSISRNLLRLFLGLVALLGLHLAPPAAAGTILDSVKSRGELRCGVSEGIPGFSARDAEGRWSGLDADFCRAVAAAVLGDPARVAFLPLKASARFPSLKARSVDLLARNTTWTMLRETTLKVQFPAVLYYDGQGFMVAGDGGLKGVEDLNGATVCVEQGTTHELNLREHFAARGMQVTPLIIDSAPHAAAALFERRCRAYSSDASQLAALRLLAPAGASFIILPERISKEPLGPVVLRDDPDWITLVRWVLFALIEAEERGIGRDNAAAQIGRMRETERALVAGGDRLLGLALGIPDGWGLRAIQAVGNYGEMYERNLGAGSVLHIERGLNRLWNQGGLMYAPPLR